MMTGRAWFPGSELAGVVTAMITYKGRARALTRQSPVRHLVPRHPKDFADSLCAWLMRLAYPTTGIGCPEQGPESLCN